MLFTRFIHLPAFMLFFIFYAMLSSSSAHASEAVAYKAIAGTPPAPSLKLPTLKGETVNLESLRGKVVLVNFWATWCVPCRKEIPSMQRLWFRLDKSKFHILAIDIGEDETAINNFLSAFDHPPTFPITLDKESATLKTWPVKALPTTFLIDQQGRMAYQAIGGLEFDSPASINVIQSLMSSKP